MKTTSLRLLPTPVPYKAATALASDEVNEKRAELASEFASEFADDF